MICGDDRPEFPDLGEATYGCCFGTAVKGPEWCTCWVPEYDKEQAELGDPHDPPSMPRDEMCHDCAYRPDSPERNGEEGYSKNDYDELMTIVYKGEPFYCHQGMRRITHWRHEPSGTVIEAHPGSYAPPIEEVGGCQLPFKADGTSGDLCAGWFARYARTRKK